MRLVIITIMSILNMFILHIAHSNTLLTSDIISNKDTIPKYSPIRYTTKIEVDSLPEGYIFYDISICPPSKCVPCTNIRVEWNKNRILIVQNNDTTYIGRDHSITKPYY